MKILNGWPTQTPEAILGTQNVGAPKRAAVPGKGGMLSCGGEGRRGVEVLWTMGGPLWSSGAGVVVAAALPGPWAQPLLGPLELIMPRVRVPKTERIRSPQQCKSMKGFYF